MKARRLAAVTTLAVLVAGGLAACQADPRVAAYVGPATITEAQVDEVVDGLDQTLTAQLDQQLGRVRQELDQRVQDDPQYDQATADADFDEFAGEERASLDRDLVRWRDQVVELQVITEAAQQYADAEGVPVAPADPQLHAAGLGLPAEHPFVHLVADYRTVIGSLQSSLSPVAPQEVDQREIYDNLVAAGLSGVTFADAQQVITVEEVGEAVATRDLLVEVIDRADISLNPRYQLTHRVPVSLGGAAESWLSVPLGDPAVVDAG